MYSESPTGELIADIRNKLQFPMTVLSLWGTNKDITQKQVDSAYACLETVNRMLDGFREFETTGDV